MNKARIELLANVAIILATVVFVAVVINKYYQPNKLSSGPVGETVTLPEVDWKKNGHTVVLALQEGCHFCTESAAFYKRLSMPLGEVSSVSIVAVLPGETESSHNYLSRLGLDLKEIRQASLKSIKADATPSLLVIDSTGRVIAAWVGKLDTQQENEVIEKLKRL